MQITITILLAQTIFECLVKMGMPTDMTFMEALDKHAGKPLVDTKSLKILHTADNLILQFSEGFIIDAMEFVAEIVEEIAPWILVLKGMAKRLSRKAKAFALKWEVNTEA